jgi:hypothetical protein
MSETKSRWIAALALLGIVLGALALRLHGIGFGLPHMTYRDGMVIYTQVKEIRTGDAELRKDEFWGYYPHVTSRFAALFDDAELAPLVAPLDVDGHVARAAQPWISLRRSSVLLSLLTVVGAYWIARRFMGRGGSLLAAAFAATSLLHLSFSQQEKPHGPVSGTVALALAAALWLADKPTQTRMWLAVAAAAIAACTLQSGGIVLGGLGVLWLCWCFERPLPKARLLLAPLCVALLGVLAVRYFYPFHFVETGAALPEHELAESSQEVVLDLAGHPFFLRPKFTGGKVVLSTLVNYDPSLLLFGLIGIGFFVVDRMRRLPRDLLHRRALAIVLGATLPFLFVLISYDAKVTFERFLMPMVACFACLAAYGVTRVGKALPQSLRRAPILTALGVLAVLPATAAAWKLTAVRAAPDTWTQVAHWIRANVDPQAKIYTVPYIDVPLFKDEASLRESGRTEEINYWARYAREIPEDLRTGPNYRIVIPKAPQRAQEEFGADPIGHLRSLGADYVVVQAAAEDSRNVLLAKIRKQLAGEEELVFRTSPIGDPATGRGQFALRYTQELGVQPLALRVFEANAYGNTIEVYRLRRP